MKHLWNYTWHNRKIKRPHLKLEYPSVRILKCITSTKFSSYNFNYCSCARCVKHTLLTSSCFGDTFHCFRIEYYVCYETAIGLFLCYVFEMVTTRMYNYVYMLHMDICESVAYTNRETVLLCLTIISHSFVLLCFFGVWYSSQRGSRLNKRHTSATYQFLRLAVVENGARSKPHTRAHCNQNHTFRGVVNCIR